MERVVVKNMIAIVFYKDQDNLLVVLLVKWQLELLHGIISAVNVLSNQFLTSCSLAA